MSLSSIKLSFFLFIFIFFSTTFLFGQPNADTTIDRKHYNFVDYYPNGKLRILGNYADTLKVGNWIYYRLKKEMISAYGQYENSCPVGKWVYINGENTIKVIWDKKKPPAEKIEYTKKGEIIIKDYIYSTPCIQVYINGQLRMTGHSL